MEAVTDALDGSFQIEPKPRAVRSLRLVILGIGATDVLGALIAAGIAAITRTPGLLLAAVVILVAGGALQLVLMRFLKPPVLRADATTVQYSSLGQRTLIVPRAELTSIFLGQVVQRARYTAWVQSYIFAVSNGKVVFSVPALWFDVEAIRAFAARLGVPVRGDFTGRVQDAVRTRL